MNIPLSLNTKLTAVVLMTLAVVLVVGDYLITRNEKQRLESELQERGRFVSTLTQQGVKQLLADIRSHQSYLNSLPERVVRLVDIRRMLIVDSTGEVVASYPAIQGQGVLSSNITEHVRGALEADEIVEEVHEDTRTYHRFVPTVLPGKYYQGTVDGVFTLEWTLERGDDTVRRDADAVSLLVQESITRARVDIAGARQHLQTMVKHFGELEGVVHVEIIDRAGRVIADTREERIGLEVEKQHRDSVRLVLDTGQEQHETGKSIYNIFTPVYLPGISDQPYAVVEVKVDLTGIPDKIAGLRNNMIIVGVMLATILAVILIWATRTTVIKPVRRLASAMDAITRGDSMEEAEERSQDELGELARTFNQMIRERRETEARLDYLAYHDTLTDLPNRALFRDRLEHAILLSGRRELMVALLFLDLDRFKQINDSLGHNVGDEVLKAVAIRLRTCVREGDTVARLGGDEFSIVLEGVADIDDAVLVAEKVMTAFSQSFDIAGHELFVTASIGISVYPHDDLLAENLVMHADTAMYHAKEGGRSNYQFYSEEMTAKVSEHLEMETKLHRALDASEYVLHYQPIFDLRTGRICGMEALLRWDSPERGLVLPGEFIETLEDTGMVVPVGEWVLREACRQWEHFRKLTDIPLMMGVNLSTRQCQERSFPERVAQIIRETGMDPAYLQLEITESTLMDQPTRAIPILSELREIGVSIAIDDFGTGYSSLSYLMLLPIDTVKVDQSFMRDITSNTYTAALVHAIVEMCHIRNLITIAEGVETTAQLAVLQEQGFDAVQGYVFSQPLALPDMEVLLQNRATMAGNPASG